MTLQQAINPIETSEEPLGIEEIIYSRTDKRGVIRSGNTVFQRVAGFAWDRLIGAPHRLVRHPDTPKAAFALFWKTIQQGRPFAGFVKNRSNSGRWYWVLTAVVPIDDGHFSVQIKPTGKLFALVLALYAEIVAAEQGQGLSPEKSCEMMLRRLEEMGFPTYSEFASRALEEEISLWDTALGRGNTVRNQALRAIISNLTASQDQQNLLLGEFQALQAIPTNMRIIASRLEPSGGPISAISDNYKYASNEISHQLEAFAGSKANLCRSMAEVVTKALVLSGFDRLLNDLPRQFSREKSSGVPVDFMGDLDFLAKVQRSYGAMAKDAMIRADALSGDLYQASAEIRRMMLGLDTIRVMGRVESGRLGAVGVGLASTIDQLDARHGEIARSLQRLMDLSVAIKAGINAYQRDKTVPCPDIAHMRDRVMPDRGGWLSRAALSAILSDAVPAIPAMHRCSLTYVRTLNSIGFARGFAVVGQSRSGIAGVRFVRRSGEQIRHFQVRRERDFGRGPWDQARGLEVGVGHAC